MTEYEEFSDLEKRLWDFLVEERSKTEDISYGITMSYPEVAKNIGCSREKVISMMLWLEDGGWLRVKRRASKPSTYYLERDVKIR